MGQFSYSHCSTIFHFPFSILCVRRYHSPTMDLVFLGIQGSGKGTQARRLADEFGYYVFDMGYELRAIAGSGTELGNTVKSYIDEGHLVPADIIMKVVREALEQHKKKHILFDGIPRDMDQKREFDAIMKELKRTFRCINILLPYEEAFQRIKGRASVEGRADDADDEKIRRRMSLFKEKTMPVVEKYIQEEKLVQVDGSGSMDEVYELIKQILLKT